MKSIHLFFVLIIIFASMTTNAQNSDYLSMIEYASKAPSGHNTQPWLFEIRENQIIIYPNFEKKLPIVDFDNRELFISLGCALENLCLKASELKYHTCFSIDNQGIITVDIEKSDLVTKNLLFEQIIKRQTNRSVYNKKEIPTKTIDKILYASNNDENIKIYVWKNHSAEFSLLTKLILEGNEIQMNNTAFKNELLSWIRFNKKHSEKSKDGISYEALGAPNLPMFISRAIVKSALNAKRQNKTDKKKIDSSSHLVLFTSKENTIASWVKTGLALECFLLLLTQEDIAHAYLNQACEIPQVRQKLQTELSLNNEFPQIILRIGYAKALPYSKRKNIDELIKN